MSKQDFISLFHTKRKENKNSWFTMFETIEGEAIALKAYGTWIQRLEYKGFKDSGPSDCKVKEVTAYLEGIL
jgi:hypothetical protein